MKIYADGAGLDKMAEYAEDERIAGFTTNPSLMRAAGIKDYRTFAKRVLEIVRGKPVSFEVLADDFPTMERQAREIASWGPNVWVKIPVTNTQGESSTALVERLADLNLNITAVMTGPQVFEMASVMRENHILSLFIGRIADTGITPWAPILKRGQLLWASAREVVNVAQADELGYHIITLTPDLLKKYFTLWGKDLAEYSLETVRQFHQDGRGLAL